MEGIQKTRSDKVFHLIFLLVIALFALACLYPFVLVVMSSLTSETSLEANGYSIFPQHLSLAAYQAVFSSGTVGDAYFVTVFTTVVGTILSLLITAAAAYALSGRRLRYRNQLNLFFYITMLFSGGLVPSYILITNYLHMFDSIWVYIIPSLLNPWNMFLMRNFFNDIPTELYDAAKMDGAGEMRTLFNIVLPLSLPAMATIGLFYALGYWGAWQQSMLYTDMPSLYSLQYIIMEIIHNISTAQGIASEGSQIGMVVAPTYTVRLATSIVTIGPIILLYPFLQRFFVSGLRVGAVKG